LYERCRPWLPVELAQHNLEYYDKILDISRVRCKAGDIAKVDLDRLELQRVQYESDLQTADVTLRTAKIQLLQMLSDCTPGDQCAVEGVFDFWDAVAVEYRTPNGAGQSAGYEGGADGD
jgi:cobalt-zinc-cadmium efflux system outer membrane protein